MKKISKRGNLEAAMNSHQKYNKLIRNEADKEVLKRTKKFIEKYRPDLEALAKK